MAATKPVLPVYVAPGAGTPFVDMNFSEKMTWLGKVFVMLITGGFAFPNIFVE